MAVWRGRRSCGATNPSSPDERLANYWHGDFPWRHDDGYGSTAAVGSYPANGYGLHDMAGQRVGVDDRLVVAAPPETPDRAAPADRAGRRSRTATTRRSRSSASPARTIKGGSYLCADSYCQRYRPAARRPQMVDTGMSHIGFRCITRDREGDPG